jgi:SAM-dependent methyltransferase
MASDHFTTQSAQYAQYRPTYPAAIFDWLGDQVKTRDTAWDCACGNGQATRDIAARFQCVIATDLSAAQIAHAPALPNVEWRVAHAEDSGIESASVDLITVAQALHWFDLPRFWQEVRRVLRPGGVIAVWSYGVFVIEPPNISAICQHFYEEVVGPYWPPERRIVEAGYGALEFPFDEIIAPPFEMQVEWSLDALLGYLGSWSATARYTQDRGASPIPELRERLAVHWPPTQSLAIHWPISMRVGRAQS